MTETSKFM